MPRPLEFEVEPALTAVMEVFRHQGFDRTSVKALCEATGQSSGSLYNCFGDKAAMFRRALDHYIRLVVAGRIDQHLGRQPPREGLLSYFLSLLEEPGDGSAGCLLTNSAIEFAGAEGAITQAIRTGFGLQERAFQTALATIFPKATDIPDRALQLLALYQGVLVLVRFGHPKASLRTMITRELATLTGARDD